MTLYYVYIDPDSRGYEIYQTREEGLVGRLGQGDSYYYFACFSRLIDASDYVKRLNADLRKGR